VACRGLGQKAEGKTCPQSCYAPAVGRGMAERLTSRRYQSIDLPIFGYERVVDNRAIVDRGPTA